MFCPRCSRQQISENIRFCSNCGFQLNVVKALLNPENEYLSKPSPDSIATNRSRRKNDLMIGAGLMCLFALHTAWTTEDLSLEREYWSLILKCLLLFALFNVIPTIRDFFLYRKMAKDALSPEINSGFVARFRSKEHENALPAYEKSAADYMTGRINTSEFVVPPPSVTEDTTNLLRNN